MTKSGTVANIYAHHTFPSLPKALSEKGYGSYNFICDHSSFWNQKATSLSYGFTQLYDKRALAHSDENLPDSLMFVHAMKKLCRQPEPFYAQLVTLSSHCPYEADNCPDFASPFLRMHFRDPEAAYFLAAIHYADRSIGQFIKEVRRNGLADRSIIVITGDHEDFTQNRLEGRADPTPQDFCIPFIMLNGGTRPESTGETVAQSDIYPTLLYLTGCHDYDFRGFGENLFGPVTGAALSRNDTKIGKDIPTHELRDLNNRQNASDILIRGNVFEELMPSQAVRPH